MAPPRWPPSPPRSRGDAARDYEEYCRLLYVAMTRARDRLYVAGYEAPARPPGWLLVRSRASPAMRTGGEAVRGRRRAASVLRLAAPQRGPVEAPDRCGVADAGGGAAAATGRRGRPPPRSPAACRWRRRSWRRSRPRTAPTCRTRPNRSPCRPADSGGGHRFQRGLLTHALLQHLPEFPPRSGAAKAAGATSIASPPTLERRSGAASPAK